MSLIGDSTLYQNISAVAIASCVATVRACVCVCALVLRDCQCVCVVVVGGVDVCCQESISVCVGGAIVVCE